MLRTLNCLSFIFWPVGWSTEPYLRRGVRYRRPRWLVEDLKSLKCMDSRQFSPSARHLQLRELNSLSEVAVFNLKGLVWSWGKWKMVPLMIHSRSFNKKTFICICVWIVNKDGMFSVLRSQQHYMFGLYSGNSYYHSNCCWYQCSSLLSMHIVKWYGCRA